jgi:glycosyltransferase involved in cell wall biosynthesis
MTAGSQQPLNRPDSTHVGPLRVMVLRGVDGVGGGADKIVLRNAAQVDSHRVQMTLCFLRHRNDAEFDLDRRCAELDLDYREVLHRGATDRGVMPQLMELARQIQPHIVHSHDYKANFYATRLAHRTGVLRLATSHGWTGSGWRERRVYYPGDKLLLSRFPGVIAVSEPIRQTLVRWGARPGRVRVLLNGIDPHAYRRDELVRCQIRGQLGFGPDDRILAAVGRVEQQKRFDVLVDALRLLRGDTSTVKLVIAGDGSLLPNLRRRIEQYDLSDCVTLLGHCSNMRQLYSAFDMLVQSSDYEGTPTVVVEAMAMQIPIVATDVGGTGQLVTHEEHALLIPPRRPDLLADAIRRTWNDPTATAQRVQWARRRVESTLNFQQRTEKLQQIYRDLVVHGTLETSTTRPIAKRGEDGP